MVTKKSAGAQRIGWIAFVGLSITAARKGNKVDIKEIKMRWFKSVDDGDYKLQYMYFFNHPDGSPDETNWMDIPFVLEGVGEVNPG
jgi:hypothetical protein